MKRIRLILSLCIMVPAFAILGAFVTLNTGANPLFGLVVGAAIGAFFGLLFGGVKGRRVDAIYGPKRREESECPTELSWHQR